MFIKNKSPLKDETADEIPLPAFTTVWKLEIELYSVGHKVGYGDVKMFVTGPVHPLAQVPSHLAMSGRKEKSNRSTDVTFVPRFKRDRSEHFFKTKIRRDSCS